MNTLPIDFSGERRKVEFKGDAPKWKRTSSDWLEYDPEMENVRVGPQFFAPDKRVEDKQRYLLEWDGAWDLCKSKDAPVSQPQAEQDSALSFDAFDSNIDCAALGSKIAVLLESPHKDEYDDNNFEPLGPARGSTGQNFHIYFVSHVLPMLVTAGLTLDQKLVYRIYLVNPVPYQASLQFLVENPSRVLTDAVWTALWQNGCREDFLGRLARYRPQIVLNGCTAGVKPRVTKAVNGLGRIYGLEQHFNISHPSYWRPNLGPFDRATGWGRR